MSRTSTFRLLKSVSTFAFFLSIFNVIDFDRIEFIITSYVDARTMTQTSNSFDHCSSFIRRETLSTTMISSSKSSLNNWWIEHIEFHRSFFLWRRLKKFVIVRFVLIVLFTFAHVFSLLVTLRAIIIVVSLSLTTSLCLNATTSLIISETDKTISVIFTDVLFLISFN